MSLLHRSTDVVTVFAEEAVTDSDGNTVTKPGSVGIVCKAVVQPMQSSETAEGVSTKLRLRLVNWQGGPLGAQSAVEWNGKRYAIDGDPLEYNGSSRTARVEYRMVRK